MIDTLLMRCCPKRFRLSLSPAVVRLLRYDAVTDLILCLEAEPQTIQARKPEVSISETADQHRYRDVVKATGQAHLIDANARPRGCDAPDRALFG